MIRPARMEDLPRLLEIYGIARKFMRENGNHSQWSGNYPDRRDLEADIALERLYVSEEGETVHACFMLAAGPDPTYLEIFDGAWGWDIPYGVLHRVASDGSRSGVVHDFVAYAARRFSYLRIDTHEKNLPMQRALAREGFTHRGTIITGDGTPRLAYDKLL